MTIEKPLVNTGYDENLMKLEEVFMPGFFRYKKDYYSSSSGLMNSDAYFVHYTSAKAALNIIKQKCFWMRNAKYMSDFSEVQHGYNVMSKFVSHGNDSWEKFSKIVEEIVPGSIEKAISIYNSYDEGIKSGTYILSMSEHDECENEYGRLSMWRAFGGQSERVAIVFRIPAHSSGALALKIFFNPVSYVKDDEEYKEIEEVIENVKNNKAFLCSVNPELVALNIVAMILVNIVCMKHKGFKEEREWRCVYHPKCFASELSTRLIEQSVEDVGGVPQVIYKIPLNAAVDPVLSDLDFCNLFDGLIIGPSKYPYAMYEAFCLELEKVGVVDAASKVRVSDIPIR
jgi:hypothetical protein